MCVCCSVGEAKLQLYRFWILLWNQVCIVTITIPWGVLDRCEPHHLLWFMFSLSSPFYSSSSHLPSHNPLWLPLLHCTDACFDVCLVQGAISSLAACLWLQVWICVCVCQDTVKYFQGQGMSCIQCAQQVLEPKQQSEKRFLIWCHFEQDYLIYRCLLKPLDVTAIAVVMI